MFRDKIAQTPGLIWATPQASRIAGVYDRRGNPPASFLGGGGNASRDNASLQGFLAHEKTHDPSRSLSRPLTRAEPRAACPLSIQRARVSDIQDASRVSDSQDASRIPDPQDALSVLSRPLKLSDSMLRGAGGPSDVQYARLLLSGTYTTVTARSCTFAAHIRRSRLDAAHIRHTYDCQTRCCLALAPLTRPTSNMAGCSHPGTVDSALLPLLLYCS